MKLRIASDLHLEGFLGKDEKILLEKFVPPHPEDEGTTLMLAGDISSKPHQLAEFLKAAVISGRWVRVMFVPGNHEYYKNNLDSWPHVLKMLLGDVENLYWPEGLCKFIEVEDVHFSLGTLWGDGGLSVTDQVSVHHGLYDFRCIMKQDGLDERLFTVDDMRAVFQETRRALSDELERAMRETPEKRRVVMTHHLPSRRLVSPRFRSYDGSDGINGGFVGDCERILAYEHAPALWIHGHTHDTIDTELWGTRIICNPMGYKGEWGNPHNLYMPKFVEV